MLPLLGWVPVAASLILGVMYLFLGEARPAFKILCPVVFFAALYLQLFSSHSFVGLLLQIGLALCLAMWQRLSALP